MIRSLEVTAVYADRTTAPGVAMATFRSVIVPRPKSEEEYAVALGESLERESSGTGARCDARVGVLPAYISGNEKTTDVSQYRRRNDRSVLGEQFGRQVDSDEFGNRGGGE
ncbi:hypothetical protein MTO96_026723 [Rhipicephalus appendiculatus]